MRPSAERLAGTGLAVAATTIMALSALVLVELDREADLHREVIAGQQAKDSLEALRAQLADLAHSARLAGATADAGALQAIERRVVEVDAELDYLAQHPSRDHATTAFDTLARAALALGVNARSVAAARARGAAAARAADLEIERLSDAAMLALERSLDAQRARINDRTLAQIRLGEGLRRYVSWLLAGSIVVLVGLFGFYRWAKARERAAQRRIEHLAHHDTVTGLPNRALLADRLEQELARARRSQRGFALLLFDLDGFKAVNDTWGHAAGDRLLAIVAERARRALRASDTVGRLGGDEFLAILPETGEAGAREAAEKLREALQAPYSLGAPVARAGASIGVSLYPAHGDDAEALQRLADAALYAAKADGRNRVRIAHLPRAGAEAPAPVPDEVPAS
ncbi:MAG TPA: GGDEF domain-containing protein [Myxococcota bacterium]|nr:GGDEF domain-containing protein [Myxococcota bacterium]